MSITNPSRKGKRAPGMTSITFPCSEKLKADLTSLASKDSRTLAAFLRIHSANIVRRSTAARRVSA